MRALKSDNEPVYLLFSCVLYYVVWHGGVAAILPPPSVRGFSVLNPKSLSALSFFCH